MKLKPKLGLSLDKIKYFHIRNVFECQNIIYYVATSLAFQYPHKTKCFAPRRYGDNA